MQVERVDHPGEDWDQFAEAQPEGRLGHAAAWSRVFREAYGLEPHYLAARETDGSLVGLFPLVAFRSRPGGPARLISLPFLDAAGPIATKPAAVASLIEAACHLVTEGQVSGLEVRTRGSMASPVGVSSGQAPGSAMDRVNLVLRLEASGEAQWSALSAKVRNQCRKAEREGLALREPGSPSLFDDFLAPYQANMRDLGSPPHSRRFFEAVAAEFGPRMRFIATEREGRSVGGLVALRFGRRAYVPWASTLRSERSRCPNNQIYWEAIRWAIETGAEEFDFGRSPLDGGTYRFKKGWGAREESLDWRQISPDGQSHPLLARTESGLVRRLSRVWTKLPVPIATALGSRLRRYFSN